MNIDFGYTDTKYNPLNRRNSIALLLGAGFSVPKGYPTANQLNKQFVEFDKFNTYFSTDGLVIEKYKGFDLVSGVKFGVNGIQFYEKELGWRNVELTLI